MADLPEVVWQLTRRWAIGDDGERTRALESATDEELRVLVDTVVAHYDAIVAIVDREDTDLLWLLEATADARTVLRERATSRPEDDAKRRVTGQPVANGNGTAAWFHVRSADPPWGDYGDMLVSGMAVRQGDGSIALERVGPFVPPITVVGWDVLMVTDTFRDEIERAGLGGMEFREAVKKRIVRVDWRHWDLAAREPERYPPEAEPENYILRRKHNPTLAEEMGTLWELVVDPIERGPHGDFVRAADGSILVSERARDWLSARAGAWLRFEPA